MTIRVVGAIYQMMLNRLILQVAKYAMLLMTFGMTLVFSNHCSALESRVRNRFPLLYLKQLEEKWYSIPLETIQANGGPAPY
jgi:hypothetical protein